MKNNKFAITKINSLKLINTATGEVLLEQKDTMPIGFDDDINIKGGEGKPMNSNMNKWQKLKEKLEQHNHAMDDAPYFGWSPEFIRGYTECLKRIERDMMKIEQESKEMKDDEK